MEKTTTEVQVQQNAELEKQPQTVKGLFNKDEVRKKFDELLGKKAPGFITSILQVVASNGMLKNAEPMSIYNSAAMAATLDLPINNNLGFAYIIPYKEKYTDDKGKQQERHVAQFQLGYKGFVQLALRSGQFKNISAEAIYKGQLTEQNPLTGFTFDFTKKESDEVIGFAAYFKLLNGFEKIYYMNVEQMKAHGKKYSKTFANKYGRWELDFEGMGKKTVLKLLLSKFAPLSIEMQLATKIDQTVLKDDKGDEVQYVDHEEVKAASEIPPTKEVKESERLIEMIKSAENITKLSELKPHVKTEEDQKAYNAKFIELNKSKQNKGE